MKTGKTLTELAQELDRQQKTKVDYLVHTPALEMVPVDGELKVQFQDQSFQVQDLAHRQIGERLGIPSKYYEKMRADSPELLAENVNHWFKKNPEKRMIRTLDERARAFLSNRYQTIDNYDVADTILPVLRDIPGLDFKSMEITDHRMYIKVVSQETRTLVKSRRVGDFVESGVIIQNSEVGLGSMQILPFFHFLVCTNGMVRNRDGMKAYHIGRKKDLSDEVYAVLSDDTKRLDDRATLAKVQDVLKASMNKVMFEEVVSKMERIGNNIIMGDVPKAVDKAAEVLKLNETEKSSVLDHLIRGGDLSQYGLMNAVTRTAEDLQSYDRATELETMGGYILDLPSSSWNTIATAA